MLVLASKANFGQLSFLGLGGRADAVLAVDALDQAALRTHDAVFTDAKVDLDPDVWLAFYKGDAASVYLRIAGSTAR